MHSTDSREQLVSMFVMEVFREGEEKCKRRKFEKWRNVQKTTAVENDAGEVLQVDLMDNTSSRRDDSQVLEGLGSPLKELEALLITFHFELLVDVQSRSGSKLIDLNGVINNQIDRDSGVDQVGISAQSLGGISHGRQIDDSRDSSEILKNDTSRLELNLSGGLGSDLCKDRATGE